MSNNNIQSYPNIDVYKILGGLKLSIIIVWRLTFLSPSMEIQWSGLKLFTWSLFFQYIRAVKETHSFVGHDVLVGGDYLFGISVGGYHCIDIIGRTYIRTQYKDSWYLDGDKKKNKIFEHDDVG